MWPKALSQLVELAPHVTRLLPLADRYFKDKATGDDAAQKAIADLQTTHRAGPDAQRAALDAQRVSLTDLGDRLHADIDAFTSQQTTQAVTLQRQVSDIEKHLVSTRADALAAKQATESLEGRLTRIEAGQRRSQTLGLVALALLAAILVLIATLFLRAR